MVDSAPVDKQVKQLLDTFEKLTRIQQEEFFLEIRKFLKRNDNVAWEDLAKKELGVVMGPLSGKCPVCGK